MKIIFKVIDLGTDGRDASHYAYFSTFEEAKKAAKGKGIMGNGDGHIVEVSVYDRLAELPCNIREQALKKLTAAERAALGV